MTDWKHEMEQDLEDLRAGKISPAIANANMILYMLTKMEEMEKRIAELEKGK